MTPEDTINRRFWQIIDKSYTTQQYDLLIRRCRDLETELEQQMAKVKA